MYVDVDVNVDVDVDVDVYCVYAPVRTSDIDQRHLFWRRREDTTSYKRNVHLCAHTSAAPSSPTPSRRSSSTR